MNKIDWKKRIKTGIVSSLLVGGIGVVLLGVYEISRFVKRSSDSYNHRYHEEMEDYLYMKELEARKKLANSKTFEK
uniref:COX6C domain-containing protein n=1 Tax=Parastrongyloides trichosuri TaxID=131310 RepID=A0A0N5A1R6_PARTI